RGVPLGEARGRGDPRRRARPVRERPASRALVAARRRLGREGRARPLPATDLCGGSVALSVEGDRGADRRRGSEPERDAWPAAGVDARRRSDRTGFGRSWPRVQSCRNLKKATAAADGQRVLAMDLNALLKDVVDSGATDVHLKLGLPPIVRRDGELGALEGWEPMSEADLETVLQGVTVRTPHRLEAFRENGEL